MYYMLSILFDKRTVADDFSLLLYYFRVFDEVVLWEVRGIVL